MTQDNFRTISTTCSSIGKPLDNGQGFLGTGAGPGQLEAALKACEAEAKNALDKQLFALYPDCPYNTDPHGGNLPPPIVN